MRDRDFLESTFFFSPRRGIHSIVSRTGAGGRPLTVWRGGQICFDLKLYRTLSFFFQLKTDQKFSSYRVFTVFTYIVS